MQNIQSKTAVWAVAAVIAFTLQVTLAGMKVRVENSKAFDFRQVRTWAWNPGGAGEIMMARTQEDDPAAMKRKAEPWILDAVAGEMTRLGLEKAASQPDLTLTYYLLLTTNMTAQTMGQFLPATTAWGLPPFAEATQSLKVMNQGSLVLDWSAKGVVVWRGVAEAKIQMDANDKTRQALLRQAVQDLLKRYPPKQPKE